MVRYLVENQIVHPCPVQFTLPGIRIGDDPPTFRARPPEDDDASDMKNKIDTLKLNRTARVMEESVWSSVRKKTARSSPTRLRPSD